MSAKILVVDDEILIERLITQYFRKKIRQQEYDFIFAHNGKEALEKIQAHPDIDMMLTDINMPEMDGLALLKKVRVLRQNIRTVVISAYGDMKNIREAMNQGAFDFINKPIDFQDLEITITRTLEFVKQFKEYQLLLKEAEIKLVKTEKLSAIGKLVTGIAHEINNPINFIAGNLNETETAIQDIINHLHIYWKQLSNVSPEVKEHAEEIELEYLLEELPNMIASMKVGTERIRQITTSLCALARTDNATKIAVNIHEGIDSVLMILRHRLKGNDKRPAIKVIKEYGLLPLVECYSGQLYQVFMNLITHAIDALNELSRNHSFAEIATHPYQIRITTEVLETENSVIIRIYDNGIGMPNEVKERIFDYSFTTKTVSKGTDLGLSISRQIVEEKHRGQLSCRCIVGEGTEFIIQIPIA